MKLFPVAAIAALTAITGAAQAAPSVFAVSQTADDGVVNAYVESFSGSGSLQSRINLGAGFNPGGVAVAGNTIYVSSTNQAVIRSYNLATGAAGAAITTGMQGYGSLSADATGLWANDGTGGNKAVHITFAGLIDRTPTLSRCGSNCSAIEAFSRGGTSFLIASEGAADGSPATYDLYRTDGTLVTAGLLFNVPFGTGLAYDAAADAFIVASSPGTPGNGGSLLTYSFGGALLSTAVLGGPIQDAGFGNVRFLNDVTASAAAVPEPMSLALLVSSLGMLGFMRRRGT